MAIDPSDYHIITYRSSEQPERWSWEIHRKIDAGENSR